MTAPAKFTRSQTQPVRRPSMRLDLRRRATEHPMAMFSFAAGIALLAMAFVPSAGPAFASLDRLSPAAAASPGKVGRVSEIDMACRGQAWGAESGECLAQIVKSSGKGDRAKIRRLAPDPLTATPNVY